MNTHPVITFPPRPPTTNALSPAERAALMRTSSKLEQILGSTPHVLDFTYTHEKGRREMKARGAGHRHTKSYESADVRSEKPLPKAPTSAQSECAWRIPYSTASKRPPLLKLCLPSKPRKTSTSTRTSRPEMPVSPAAPSFTIVSETMVRREKMRRLVRRLGEGVPVELVYPDHETDTVVEEEEEIRDDDTVVVSTPTSCESKAFSLASISEEEERQELVKPERVRMRMRHEPEWQTPRVSRFARMPVGGRDAIYVVNEEDEYGLEDEVPTTGMCLW